jgi:hypothetical protein
MHIITKFIVTNFVPGLYKELSQNLVSTDTFSYEGSSSLYDIKEIHEQIIETNGNESLNKGIFLEELALFQNDIAVYDDCEDNNLGQILDINRQKVNENFVVLECQAINQILIEKNCDQEMIDTPKNETCNVIVYEEKCLPAK